MTSRISLVIPAYNEQATLLSFFDQLYPLLEQLSSYTWEVIFINDGSRDATRECIKTLAKNYEEVRGINLSRNFGKEVALTAGIEAARGDAVITIDADGQHPVDKIPEFLAQRKAGYAIVYNKRSDNAGASFFKKLSSRVFYFIFNKISKLDLESQATDYRLLDRRVVDVFLQFTEKNRIYRGLIDRIGFPKKALEFPATAALQDRRPTYNYGKLFTLALDSITSFSLFPLKLVGPIGFLLSLLSLIGIMWIVIDRLTGGVNNFTNLGFFTLVNTFLIGIVMTALGMVAIYIANIHEEVRGRPLYIIQEEI